MNENERTIIEGEIFSVNYSHQWCGYVGVISCPECKSSVRVGGKCDGECSCGHQWAFDEFLGEVVAHGKT